MMLASVSQIPNRTLNFQQLNLQEINTLLQFLRDVESRLAQSETETDFRPINITFADDFPSYSIFTIEHGMESFYFPKPNPKAKKAPGDVFCTNGRQPITADSGNNMTCPCYMMGMERPHKIRYNFTGTQPSIGTRMQPPSGQSYLEINSNGNFVAVSVPDTVQSWIWVIYNPVTAEAAPPTPIVLPLGTAVLTQNMCTTDATATVSSPLYYDATAIPSVTSVSNVFKHQGKTGDLVKIEFINTGAGSAWQVTDVVKVARTVVHDLAFGYTQGQPDTCAILKGITTIAVEECATVSLNPVDYQIGIQLWIHEIPYTYEVTARASEDSVRDTCQTDCPDPCEIVTKTKKFCMFQQTPEDGANKVVATLTPKTFLKKIYESTMCVSNELRPSIKADIQTVYVVCADNPAVENQITGVKCSGTYTAC